MLVECFAAWKLLVPGSEAIDVGRVRPTALSKAPYRTGIRMRGVAATRQAVADDFWSTGAVRTQPLCDPRHD